MEEVSGDSRAIEDKQETEIGAVAIQAEDRGTETYHISYNVSTIQEIQPIGHPVSHPVIRAVIFRFLTRQHKHQVQERITAAYALINRIDSIRIENTISIA